MAELVDALDSGSSWETGGCSSHLDRMLTNRRKYCRIAAASQLPKFDATQMGQHFRRLVLYHLGKIIAYFSCVKAAGIRRS